MYIAATLSLYIARQFMAAVTAMLLALTGLVSLFDFIELLRRSATRPDATFGLVMEIAALRLPYIAMQILPFAVLLGGIIAFWRLTRSSELVVARAAGVSAWQFLAAPSPVHCSSAQPRRHLSARFRRSCSGRRKRWTTSIYGHPAGRWRSQGGSYGLRQSDRGLDPQGVAILHARAVSLHHNVLTATDVSVFRLDAEDRLLLRIEATDAVLQRGAWLLQGARTITPDHLPRQVGEMRLPTDLTVNRVQESFASPDTLSVWALPGFISLLGAVGLLCHPPQAGISGAAGLAIAGWHNGTGVGRVFHAPDPARRRGADDRERRRRRVRAVRGCPRLPRNSANPAPCPRPSPPGLPPSPGCCWLCRCWLHLEDG